MNYKLFFFACALNLYYYVPNLLASSIIGGQEDTSHTYKYHVSIRRGHNPTLPNSGRHFCGGTIIHDRYVLSVAHPFLRVNNGIFERVLNPRSHGIVVVSGTSETQGLGIISQVDKIFIPGVYNMFLPFYADISVVKLAADLNVALNSNRLEILPIDQGDHSSYFYENKNALILGNGVNTVPDGRVVPTIANKRHFLEVHMTPKNLCPEFYYAICAVNIDTSRIQTCGGGDSGSPLVFDHTVIGVISLGPKDSRRNPILCTRVWRFINFIRVAMNENGNHSQMYILAN